MDTGKFWLSIKVARMATEALNRSSKC